MSKFMFCMPIFSLHSNHDTFHLCYFAFHICSVSFDVYWEIIHESSCRFQTRHVDNVSSIFYSMNIIYVSSCTDAIFAMVDIICLCITLHAYCFKINTLAGQTDLILVCFFQLDGKSVFIFAMLLFIFSVLHCKPLFFFPGLFFRIFSLLCSFMVVRCLGLGLGFWSWGFQLMGFGVCGVRNVKFFGVGALFACKTHWPLAKSLKSTVISSLYSLALEKPT